MRKIGLLLFAAMLVVILLSGCNKSENFITSIEDAQHAKIGVMIGSTGESTVDAMFSDAQVKRFDDILGALAALTSGQLDAVVAAYPIMSVAAKNNLEFCLLEQHLCEEDISIALKKGQDDLLATLNQIIAQLNVDGTLADLKMRWIGQDSGAYEERETCLAIQGTVLRVGMSGTDEPFTFLGKDGQVTGYDAEFAEIVAAKLQRPIEFVTMKFMSLIPALESGKIDLIISNMTATDERRKAVDFTQPYFIDSQVMLVKKKSENEIVSLPFIGNLIDGFRNNILHENRYLLILDGLKTTVIISVMATVMGTFLGGLICFLRMSPKIIFNLPAKIYISIMRGTPVLVLLMLIFYVVFASIDISPVVVSIIAFGLNFAAYAAEIFRTGIEGVDKGQSEAGIAMGFSKVKTFVYIVLPQTVRRILPVYKGEFITLVKMTSIVGYIAVQDLTKASDIIRSRTFDAFFPLVMIAILYFLISFILLQSLEYVERVTDPKYKRARLRSR